MHWYILKRQAMPFLLNKSNNNTSVKRLLNVSMRHAHNNKDGQDPHGFEKSSITQVANYWQERFENEGVTESKESIEHIIFHILGTRKIKNLASLNEKRLNPDQLQKLDLLCNCRLSRMPIQYIIGEWDFRDITLKLEPPIFIPRPETEVLVDYSLKSINNLKNKSCSILEIGCGSGAISLSLLKSNNDLTVTAIDINPHACDLTMQNAKNLKLDLRLSLFNAKMNEDGTINILKNDFSNQDFNFMEKKFDFIISNPPYIPTKKIFKLQPEITLYEDIVALDGGKDGLQLIKAIIKFASQALYKGGYLILEVDSTHPSEISSFIEQIYSDELKVKEVYKDFCKNDRFVEIVKIK
ncbi:hemK methyltransferase family member 1 [Copidosoma floridanum]|uniref:hemK methyltransferase family member 1 n=1 Tax=Copidosoma floridanum TaxID=29053 RepID=UPI0006C9A03B|nr:hemK methyltransferase family member 1 [Copidosoma floridanum]